MIFLVYFLGLVMFDLGQQNFYIFEGTRKREFIVLLHYYAQILKVV